MTWDDADLIADFLVEAEEHLDEADAVLLQLEGNVADAQLRRRLNGCFHTLKGMASYVDFKEVELLCHVTESLIAAIAGVSARTGARHVDLALQVVTTIRAYFGAVSDAIDADAGAPSTKAMLEMYARIANIVRAAAS